jgi:aspartate ammonia-lyase
VLTASVDVFGEKCIKGITANRDTCAASIEKSLAMVTGLVPHIGYDRAAAIAKKAHETGKTIREVVLSEKILPEDLIDKLLKPLVQ